MTVPAESWKVHAPAKINLALHVLGQRADRYHEVETLAVFADFGDELTVEPFFRDDFLVAGKFAWQVPAGDDNLVLRARNALRQAFPAHTDRAVRIILEKNVPVASGIGGGSSDAAATLRALRQCWALAAPDDALAKLALTLGADVPMCLFAQPLIARGIGERIEPMKSFPPLAMVLVNPGVALSTAEVFSRLESRDNLPLPFLPERINSASLAAWLGRARNDLEPAARGLAPVIGEALEALEAQGASLARMSGSGATCFGLFEDPEQARLAAVALRNKEHRWFVEAVAGRGHGEKFG